ncbi:hypothetical protein A2348_05205 [Candidatus Uhrbacteria bacterium RIFOXYB12_FULL_58_10]|uniref:Small-conductance mechanosensitive ion channel n=1 Tax=Candidatus Uhrbacteria bacterium RIFOXYB2_FULL_57_15 TaxID=1802422 RepID=A0A1F7W4H3_9BACT|nr:MAG: hypothetical protein A2348_05205 [Candidatus Uhrbacteria bacterium RIFOXYB12_FULL_58_10]OGL97723.1 MAG: hypothetical protein A2304_00465 [Candidatus Uhrbacteria bacterium RIFOXYB2_FULL_57_15]OGM00022.1 MAG: hypothetical protein A2501_03670 [Candidatus Uhrbacteria bacterium RIFOXYC12_FULL_57_11]
MQPIDVIQVSVLGLWNSVLAYLPNVLGALLVFLIGVIVAAVLQTVVVRLVQLLRVDELVGRLELRSSLEKVGIRLHVGKLLGWIVKWFFIIVALVAATDILGWNQVTNYLQEVVLYIPNVIVAVIILLAGILLATFVRNVVKTAVSAAELSNAEFLSGIAKWAILLFSFMAALVQLQIAPGLINTLFTGLIAMLSLAGGLAFGLGGKDHASRVLDRLRRDLSSEK